MDVDVPLQNINKEEIFEALTEFGRKGESVEIPVNLENYLNHVARSGETLFPWPLVKCLVKSKIDQVLQEFLVISPPDSSVPILANVEIFKYQAMRGKILEALDFFASAPFTIQRLCELVVDPKRYYKRIDKLMRAIEKNLLVTTTIEPRRASNSMDPQGVSSMMNGFEDKANGHDSCLDGSEGQIQDSSSSSCDVPMDISGPPPPLPVAVDAGEAMEATDDTASEDIEVDQPSASQGTSTPPPSLDGQGSSQEAILQIQQHIRNEELGGAQSVENEQQSVPLGASPSTSSPNQEGVTEEKRSLSAGEGQEVKPSEGDAAVMSDDSCSNDNITDGETDGAAPGCNSEAEQEQQVPQFGSSCDSGSAQDTQSRSPLQFQAVSSQSEKRISQDSDSSQDTNDQSSVVESTSEICSSVSRVDQEGSNEAQASSRDSPGPDASGNSEADSNADVSPAGDTSAAESPVQSEGDSNQEATASPEQGVSQSSSESTCGDQELSTTTSPPTSGQNEAEAAKDV